MVGQTLSHYSIQEKIGEGGMGVVYRAHDDQLDRDVAIKVLPTQALARDSARKRFRKEALALGRLNHPNIETVHEFGSDRGLDFLVTEYISGATLNDKLTAGALPERQILSLGIQLAEGLEAAHDEGVVHRDLKPANLRIRPDGRLKILDFGLATLIAPEASQETASLADSTVLAGTLAYMAPEQLRGETADRRTDIWAAGVVLYEMTTGRRPFEKKMSTALAGAILNQPPPTPGQLNPSIAPRLGDAILKCLEKDPDNRYQSAKELLVDLRRLATPSTVTTQQRWPPGRALYRFGVGTLAIVMILAALFVFNVRGWRERLMRPAGAARIESLAVLPLENLSSDSEQQYFADGMTDELITDLGKVSELRVISRTSVMQYKGTRKPLPEIAKELKVDAIVEGSVLRAGDHVRITARLTNAAKEKQLFASSYEGDLRDVLRLQKEVARDIAAEIRAKLTPSEQSRLVSSPQLDPRAYEAYLKGRYQWNQRGATGLKKALESFQQAIEIDPTYGAAYAGLADTYNLLASSGDIPGKEGLEMARAAAKRALELDENLAEAHTALAGVLQSANDWNFNAAEAEFRRAIELNPNYATARLWHAQNLLVLNRADEAVAEYRQAEGLDPLSPLVSAYVGFSLEKARRYDEAIAAGQKTITLFPESPFGHWTLAMAYRQKGMHQEAIAAFKKAIELSPHRPDFIATLGHAYAVSGNKDEASKIAHELEASHAPAFALALVYVGLGDMDRSFALLEQTYEERFPILPEALQDPLFDPVRPDPRFQTLLRRIGLPQ